MLHSLPWYWLFVFLQLRLTTCLNMDVLWWSLLRCHWHRPYVPHQFKFLHLLSLTSHLISVSQRPIAWVLQVRPLKTPQAFASIKHQLRAWDNRDSVGFSFATLEHCMKGKMICPRSHPKQNKTKCPQKPDISFSELGLEHWSFCSYYSALSTFFLLHVPCWPLFYPCQFSSQ